jgi:hypothetical protein
MRRVRVFLAGILAVFLAGCVNDRPARSTSLIDRVRGIGGPSGPDAVFIEYTNVERPAGDSAMNRQIWSQVDELIIPAETRALLAENGLRCGVVGSLLPSELEAMLQNPRSALGARQRRLYVNNSAPIVVAGPVAQADYRVRPTVESKETTARFEQAKFVMNFTPVHGDGGRVSLKCVPEVEYNDKKRWTPIGAAGEAWAEQKPLERYQSLSFDVTLSPREFLVIGADFNRGDWLGNQMFTDTRGNLKVQRLLIIRTGHLATVDTNRPLKTASKDEVIPLASQAEISAVRGSGP